MEPERQSRVEQLVQEALEVNENQRGEFLDRHCAGNEGLRAEVESLLAFAKDADNFMEASALRVAAEALAGEDVAPLAPEKTDDSTWVGRTIAHYRVLSKLGSGGMGVVYKAEDLRVGRHVALKLLLESHASNSKVLLRFQHEARAIASLSHPHICTLYEVEECQGKPVIVMELLEGETLKQRMNAGRVSLPQVLQWGIEVADALATAHATGIIHRDVKPANIFITSRRSAKVLDFGLAKLSLAQPGAASPIFDEESLTSLGVIPGTTPYMSPEQIRGDELDGRSDVFSLGAVLYEMATGQRAFAQKNVALIMEAVLNERPAPVTQVNPELPEELEQIIEKASNYEKYFVPLWGGLMRDRSPAFQFYPRQFAGDDRVMGMDLEAVQPPSFYAESSVCSRSRAVVWGTIGVNCTHSAHNDPVRALAYEHRTFRPESVPLLMSRSDAMRVITKAMYRMLPTAVVGWVWFTSQPPLYDCN